MLLSKEKNSELRITMNAELGLKHYVLVTHTTDLDAGSFL